MAFRFLKNHLRDIEKWVCSSSHFDLTGERLDAFFVRQQTQINLRKRLRRFTALPPIPLFTALSWRTFFSGKPLASFASGRPGPVVAPAVFFPPRSGSGPPLWRTVRSLRAPLKTFFLP